MDTDVEKSGGLSLAWGMGHRLYGLMTYMVVQLGKTCFSVQCVLRQRTVAIYLKWFGLALGHLGQYDTRVLRSCCKAARLLLRAEVPESSELYCFDLFYMWFYIEFLLLVEEEQSCCTSFEMTLHVEFLCENIGSLQFQSPLQGICSQTNHVISPTV